MAYPTNINFKIVDLVGAQEIDETSTTQRHPIGTRVKAIDHGTGARGEAEFVYAIGVASTAAGDACIIDYKGGAAIRGVSTSRGPVGIAMSANVASQYGWYCIKGVVPVSAESSDVAADVAVYMNGTAAGEIEDTAASNALITGLIPQAAESGDFAECQLHYPSMEGLSVGA